MEDTKHNQQVERKMKEATRGDRARLQIGRISGFGLMEMSRQRLRPSLLETNFEKCPHCTGAGLVRSCDSAALSVLRAIEDEGLRGRANELAVDLPNAVALYLLTEKREELNRLSEHYACKVYLRTDEALLPHDYKLTILEARSGHAAGVALPPRGPAAHEGRRIFAEDAATLNLPQLTAEDLNEKAQPPRDDGDEGDGESRDSRDRTRNRRTRTRGRTKGEPRSDKADSESAGNSHTSGEQPGDMPGPVADEAAGDARSGEKRRRNRRGGSRRNGRGTGAGRERGPNEAPANANQAQPAFTEATVLEIDTTPKRSTARRTGKADAAGADAAEPKKVGWWKRWTGG